MGRSVAALAAFSPFAANGATVTGIDIHKPSIETAKEHFFAERGVERDVYLVFRTFSITAFYNLTTLIILHDALEHIPE